MRKILLSIFLVLSTIILKAQYWVMEYGIASTYPMYVLQDNGYKSGLGHSLTILSRPFPKYYNWQLQMGGNVNYFWANNAKGDIYYFVNDETYPSRAAYKAKNRHTAISFKTRLSSKPNPVRYFFDLDLGYRNFKTKETIKINDYNSELNQTSTLISDGNFFAGITGGFLFRMNRYWYLTLYARFDYGLNTDWLALNSVNFANISGYTQPNYSYYNYPTTHTPLLWNGFSMTFYFGGDGSPKKEKKSYAPTPSTNQPSQPQRGNEIPPIEIPKIEIPKVPKSKPKTTPKPIPPIKPKPPIKPTPPAIPPR